jgi:hypothetical protein
MVYLLFLTRLDYQVEVVRDIAATVEIEHRSTLIVVRSEEGRDTDEMAAVSAKAKEH